MARRRGWWPLEAPRLFPLLGLLGLLAGAPGDSATAETAPPATVTRPTRSSIAAKPAAGAGSRSRPGAISSVGRAVAAKAAAPGPTSRTVRVVS